MDQTSKSGGTRKEKDMPKDANADSSQKQDDRAVPVGAGVGAKEAEMGEE